MIKLKIFLIAILLFSCARSEQTIEKSEIRGYTLIKIDPPKHFYVDLKDDVTGKTYKHVYVSKHCNDYRKLVVGKTYQLRRIYYTRSGQDISDFDCRNLRSVFCNSCN